jgi:hypothetical protein
MLGTILVSIGTFLEEISDSIGKTKVNSREESTFTMAFLSLFWGAIFFIFIGIFKNDGFVFKLASLPTFSIRVILEIIQTYISVLAIVKADRSTYGFIRTITVPLLLIVDFVIGYKLGFLPIVGMSIIIITLLVLFLNKGIRKNGVGFVVFSAINAVITISLFKYDITHFNSVAAEQLLIYLILLLFFVFFAFVQARENPFAFLKKPIFFLQSASVGLGGVIESFGYNYGAASIIVAAKRSSAVFWSLLSGKVCFEEKNVFSKFTTAVLLFAGLILLSIK